MKNFNFRYVKAGALISFLVGFTTSLAALNAWLSNHWEVTVSVCGGATLLLGAINLYLWKFIPCSYLYTVPDLSGEYEGELHFQYRDAECKTVTGTLKHKKVVTQNGSSIVIRSYTTRNAGETTESKSIHATIEKESDGAISLMYNYLNDGDTAQGFAPHYGTETLKLVEEGDKKKLVGRYYTERLPFGTMGKIDVTKK